MIKIRTALPGDEAQIAKVHVQAWQEAYKAILPQDYLDRLPTELDERTAMWKNILADPKRWTWVAVSSNGLVGFVVFGPPRDSNREGFIELGAIYLLAAEKNKGHGYSLLSAGFTKMTELGYSKAYCWVLENNPTQNFYKRSGANFTGQIKIDEIGGKRFNELAYEWDNLKPKLILRELNQNDDEAFKIGLEDWKTEDLSWYTFVWKPGMSHAEHLQILKDQKDKAKLPPERVPSTMLYGFINNKIVGRINIRHELNQYLFERGGHVGYSVSPQQRKKGYAKEMFRQGMEYCTQLGLDKILVTCADQNTPSWKVIEHFGGLLENRIFDVDKDEFVRRYWINLRLRS